MGVSPATTLPIHLDVERRPARGTRATTAGVVMAIALRTLLLVAAAVAGILVLLPAALGAVNSGVLGTVNSGVLGAS